MDVTINGVAYMPKPSLRSTAHPRGTLGGALRGRRKMLEMTLEKAAEKIGTSKSYLWELEHDESMPSLALAAKIARVYGLPLDALGDYTIVA